jgi:hypothetical protein
MDIVKAVNTKTNKDLLIFWEFTIDKTLTPKNKNIGTSNGFLALKFFPLTKKIISQVIIIMSEKTWLALTVIPRRSKDPILSKGNKKATSRIPKNGFLKIKRVKVKKTSTESIIRGASLKK